MSEWIHNWIAKGWAGTQVENRDLFERLYHLISLRRPDQVQFVYVPGHSGEHGNTQADLLARVGAGNC
jgi:ribonuclease HI